VRAWGGFGVVLDPKNGELAVLYPLDRPVVEVDMGDLELWGAWDAALVP